MGREGSTRSTLVSTSTLPARRRFSVMDTMSTLSTGAPAALAIAALYLSCLSSTKSLFEKGIVTVPPHIRQLVNDSILDGGFRVSVMV